MWRVGVAGGSPQPLGRGRSPDGSPDGSRIAFVITNDIWIMRADGSGRRRLVNHPTRSRTLRLAWSPGGGRLAYVHYPEGFGPESQIRVVRRDGRGDHRIRLPRRVGSPEYAHWGSG